jgi:TonB-like protein
MSSRMSFATTAWGGYVLQRYRARLTVAVTLSLLFHVFLLSLQLRTPGLGLPGLQFPWNERRAQSPELNIRLSNPNGAPSPPARPAEIEPEPRPSTAGPIPVPEGPQPLENPRTETPSGVPPYAGSGMRLLPPPALSNLPLPGGEPKSGPATAKPKREARTAARRGRRGPSRAQSRPRVIAQTQVQQEPFVVPLPPPDEPAQQITAEVETPEQRAEIAEHPAPKTPPIDSAEELLAQLREQMQATQKLDEENVQRTRQLEADKFEQEEYVKRQAMELEAQRQAEELLRQQAAQRLEEENIRRTQQLEAKRLEQEENAKRQVMELEAQRQAEEAVRRQTAQKFEEENIRQSQELQAKKLEEENAKRQVMELEARRKADEAARLQSAQKLEEENIRLAQQIEARQLEEARRQQEASAERQAREQESRRQADEAARQQTAVLANQKQAEALAAEGGAQELAARSRDGAATAQRREGRVPGDSLPAATPGARENATRPAEPESESGPILLTDSELASFKVVHDKKIDLTRLEPQAARELVDRVQASRQRTIFGSGEDDIALKRYIESWGKQVERNGNLNYTQSPEGKARHDPVVTVAIRSDGSIEGIVINRPSGRPELDEAVQRIVQLNSRYSAFPPDLARKYDVIEIRRVWNFDDKLRILEEAR